jgi:hypothetical protein
LTVNTSGGDIWYVAGYATIQATDKLSFNFRGEYLDDDSSTGEASFVYPGGHSAEELTATIQYNLWANVITRGEFRWDHTAPGPGMFGANSGGTFQGAPFRRNDFLLALNVIYQF